MNPDVPQRSQSFPGVLHHFEENVDSLQLLAA
jgi:hypothetical protein